MREGVRRRYDYLPFGEEIPVASAGWRTTAMRYGIGPDGITVQCCGAVLGSNLEIGGVFGEEESWVWTATLAY